MLDWEYMMLEMLIKMALYRIVESKAMTILCGGSRNRTRLVNEAINEGLIKEIHVTERERTLHADTYYTITKRALAWLCQETAYDYFAKLEEIGFENITVFDKSEYSTEARRKLVNSSSAMILASAAEADLPHENFSRRYDFEKGGTPHTYAYKLPLTLPKACNLCLDEKAASQFLLLPAYSYGPESEETVYYDHLYVKQALSGSNNPESARDRARGRYCGILQSPQQTLMVFGAPSFGMNWSRWVVKEDMNALMAWNRVFAPPEVRYSHEYNGLLIVKNARQFANLYLDHDHARKKGETFGGTFNRMYVAELSAEGADNLGSVMDYSEKRFNEKCVSAAMEYGLARRNEAATDSIFVMRDRDENECVNGAKIEIKTMLKLEALAKRFPGKQYSVLCTSLTEPYYAAVMPENVHIACMP